VNPEGILPRELCGNRAAPIRGRPALDAGPAVRSAAAVLDGEIQQFLALASAVVSAAPVLA
jgi:hypothetical protein